MKVERSKQDRNLSKFKQVDSYGSINAQIFKEMFGWKIWNLKWE